MTAEQWTVLDNLKNSWPYTTNLHRKWADEALAECTTLGYVADGKITADGTVALLVQNATGLPKNKVRA